MWLEVKWCEKYLLINTDEIILISIEKDPNENEEYEVFIRFNYGGGIEFPADSFNEAKIIFDGIILALNGLAFIHVGSGYIKPLKSCQQESLYAYAKFKEVVGDVHKLGGE